MHYRSNYSMHILIMNCILSNTLVSRVPRKLCNSKNVGLPCAFIFVIDGVFKKMRKMGACKNLNFFILTKVES